MIFEVAFSRAAAKTLDNLDRPTERRIRDRINEIALNPFDKRLSKVLTDEKGRRSSRIGSWRIVFLVNTEKTLVNVLAIGSGGQIYRGL